MSKKFRDRAAESVLYAIIGTKHASSSFGGNSITEFRIITPQSGLLANDHNIDGVRSLVLLQWKCNLKQPRPDHRCA